MAKRLIVFYNCIYHKANTKIGKDNQNSNRNLYMYVISNTLAKGFFLPEISVVLLPTKLSTSMWKRLFCSCSFFLTTKTGQGREFDVPLYSSDIN